MHPRRVVYIVIDGMNRDAFEQVTASRRAPALSFLRERSSYARDSVAVFPTITPAATASLVTGVTPARHGIPGMCWYDRDAERFVNYGQSPRAAIVEGLSQVVEDVIRNMNSHHLSPDVATIHEQLHHLGFTSGSINFMVFRGPFMHEVKPNLFSRTLFRKQLPEQIPGPKEHYYADAVAGPAEACTKMLSARGVDKRIRATDGWAACVTRDLLERNAADMILFYLHENDHSSHRHGPGSQVDSLIEADEHIAYVLDGFDSWEEAVEQVGFVVTADHSQSPISDDPEHIIDLFDVLDGFKVVKPDKGKEPFRKKDVALAGNGRVAFFYLDPARRDRLVRPVANALLECPGVDQVMWRDGDSYAIESSRGRLRFRPANGDGGAVVDPRGGKWSLEGDLAVIDGLVEGNEIETPEYPLAMWRIKEALDCDRIGDVVATMRLTYEARDLAGGDHRGGGDHASLHAQDSIVPFMSTLAEAPLHPTTVDVVPHIVRHFERLRR